MGCTMANDKVKLVDGKRVYAEENENLRLIEDKLDLMYEDAYKRYQSYKEEIDTFAIYDWKDRDHLIGLREVVGPCKERAEELLSIMPSPYFMRIDLDIDGKGIKKYYVGEKALAERGKDLIYNWHDKVLYDARFTRQRAFNANNHNCELYLRRAIEIQNKKLIGLKTEFDSDALILGGEVIDPFLLSVLRDKRRNSKLTNIIKTIQQNQSEIISKPIDENFVVQGCAGSGKTMILLHRLSYLLYNHKDYGVEKYCILTPNEFFDLHINDLSKDLEIDTIRRFTVEQYYEELIGRMSGEDRRSTLVNGSVTAKAKISISESQLISEKLLNEQMLSEFYSLDYKKQLIDIYSKVWDDFKKVYNPKSYCALERVAGMPVPDVTECSFRTYRNINVYHGRLLATVNQNEKDLASAKEGIESCSEIIQAYKKSHEDYLGMLPSLQSTAEDKIDNELYKCGEEYDKLYPEEDKMSKEIQEIESRKNQIMSEIGNALTEQERAMTDEDLISLSYIVDADTSFAKLIKTNCGHFIEEIKELKDAYQNVPFYNFGKKAAINRQIEARTKEYHSNALTMLIEYKTVLNSDLISKHEELQSLETQLEDNRQILREIRIELNGFLSKIAKLENAKKVLSERSFVQYNALMDEEELAFLKRDIRKLVSTINLISECQRNIEIKEKELEEHLSVSERCLSFNIDESVKRELSDLREKLELIDISKFCTVFENKIKETYDKYGQQYEEQEKYRHKLYLLLNLCFLYYGAPSNAEKFINIDEAQDVAISEYKLLKDALGENAIFNLYGDVNQLIYSYKGITDWDELNEIVTLNLYFLNENYRNTIQITDYCNKAFGAEITAIGIKGEEVKVLPIRSAITDLQRSYRDNPKLRAAIIYKKGMEHFVEKAASSLLSSECAWGAVDNNRISIITVEMAKGLEFDKVVVLTEEMTINEKYISFTRALDNLIVL